MIFGGKPVHAIRDEEILALVEQHQAERQHLEFKVTITHGEDDQRVEVLRDIASIANREGGYIFIGIRDDGHGRAQRFEPKLVGNIDRIARSMGDLCKDHIADRIEGLEIVPRVVRENPLVIIRIPDSARKPHMVIYQNRTDFWARYHDGKREMTISEIRQAFTHDWLSDQVSQISQSTEVLAQSIRDGADVERVRRLVGEGNRSAILDLSDGINLLEHRFEAAKRAAASEPWFFLAACPKNLGAVDLGSDDVEELLRNPPASRPTGWNMYSPRPRLQPIETGLVFGIEGLQEFELLRNGLLEARISVKPRFCSRQSNEEIRTRPRLYPYPVIEYPTTFLRLYAALADTWMVQGDSLAWMVYLNIEGFYLRPGAPRSIDFDFPGEDPKPCEENQLFFSVTFGPDEPPDEVSWSLVQQLYQRFGWREDQIPFFDRASREFKFGSD